MRNESRIVGRMEMTEKLLERRIRKQRITGLSGEGRGKQLFLSKETDAATKRN